MGKCNECGKNINLKDKDEITCPNCGKNPYICWNCKTVIKEPIECSVCHYYICPECNMCFKDCLMPELTNKIKNLEFPKYARKVVEIIYSSIQSPTRKICNERNVYISYAKGKNKDTYLRLKGYRCKNKDDCNKFNERLNLIEKSSIGKSWIIRQDKPDGYKGYELREALNLCVCFGVVKLIREPKKNKVGEIVSYYDKFIRIENIGACKYLDLTNLIQKKCPKCKQYFSSENVFCDKCINKKGKNKGQNVLLKETLNTKEICQLGRDKFIEKKD